MDNSFSTAYTQRTKEEQFFRRRHVATLSFALGLLLFFLPFAELRCGGVPLMKNTGIGIATGAAWKMEMGGDGLLDKLNSETGKQDSRKMLRSDPNIFLLVAIAAALFGIATTYFTQSWKNIAGMCAGILCCLMLLALMVQLNIVMKKGLNHSAGKLEDASSAAMAKMIQLRFTVWYYLSMAAFAAAAFFHYRKQRIAINDLMVQQQDFEFMRADGNGE